jgi:pSer/pThr/pTyr-binding forkhead associated (FHA) protein
VDPRPSVDREIAGFGRAILVLCLAAVPRIGDRSALSAPVAPDATSPEEMASTPWRSVPSPQPMTATPLGPHQSTPAELRERLASERRGQPFLVYRNEAGGQVILELSAETTRVTIGRSPENEVCLAWDPEVSRLHAEIERVGEHWLLVDDGVSRNGTFVAGERVSGRRRLQDGDIVRVGATPVAFRRPGGRVALTTRLSEQHDIAASVTDAQRRVLVALCRPFKGGSSYATPSTNPQIAAELVLTVAAVKTHLRTLFKTFGIDELPQHEKRLQLVALAFSSGLVGDRDL